AGSRDSSLRTGDASLGAAHLARSAHTSDRDVNAGGGGLRLGVGVHGARLRDGDFVVGRVNFHQHRSLLHVLVVFHIELQDMAADASAYRVDVPVNLRVV